MNSDRSPGLRPRRDPLFALLRWNALAGSVLGIAVTVAVLALDIGRLGTLIGNASDGGALAAALLVGGFMVTCASVMMGSAIMELDRLGRPGPSGSGGSDQAQPLMRPMPVMLTRNRRIQPRRD